MAFQLPVVVTGDFLNRLKSAPITAISELIWNSLDADADNVIVEFERDSLGAIEKITIKDNGHGISADELKITFGHLGGSIKKQKRKTESGRPIHGQKGSGRYLALSLGTSVVWKTVYNNINGRSVYYEIACNSGNPSVLDISDEVTTSEHSGVVVVVTSIRETVSNQLNNGEKLLWELNKIFAPYLLTYSNVAIIVDGIKLQPDKLIEDNCTTCFSVHMDNDNEVFGQITIIKWKEGSTRELYACSHSGVPFDTLNIGVDTGRLSFTSYLRSDHIEYIFANNILFDEAYDLLVHKAKEEIKNYYRRWLARNASNTVNKLKEEGSYPFKDEPKSDLDTAERQVFDICLIKISEAKPDLFTLPKPAKRLTMGLIKEALHQNPTNLRKVLREVLNLTEKDLSDLVEVLEKTTLSSVISMAKMVGDRLKFLNGIEQMIYSLEFSKKVKERSQLHKILLNELWIFGEQYTLGVSDQKLYNVLKDYVKTLGRCDLATDLSDVELNSMEDIPDICLWQQYSLGYPDEHENLVIELKRPSVILGDDELAQIKKYAFVVAENPRFPKEKTKWTFLLLGSEIDKFARYALRKVDKVTGVYIENENVRVLVKDWGEVIHEARARYKYLEERLNSSATNAEGIKYLQDKYNKLLPDVMKEIACTSASCD